MSAISAIFQQGQPESERRMRLGVPLAAGGVLYLLGAIILYQSLLKLPTVGVLQGLAPALEGRAGTPVSPEAAEIKFISHHSFGLIAGSVLEAMAIGFLTLALLFLLQATAKRAPEPSPAARMLVLVGGGATVVVMILAQIVRAVRTHEFATGHAFGQHAVEAAVSTGAANQAVGYLDLLMPILLVVGMIMALLRATRAGLLPRWQRTFGIIAAVVLLPLFTGAFTLQIIPAAWLVSLGFLFMARLPSGLPPAWEAGEAIPWPAAPRRSGSAPSAGALSANGSPLGADEPPDGSGTSSRARRRREKGGR